jgi:hypothetical protein
LAWFAFNLHDEKKTSAIISEKRKVNTSSISKNMQVQEFMTFARAFFCASLAFISASGVI